MERIIIILFFVLIFNFAAAQITMGLRVGGHLPTSGTALPGFVQIESDGTQKGLVGTMGGGIDVNGMFGIDLSKNVTLGFDIGYLSGFNFNFYQYTGLDGTGNPLRRDIAFKGTFINVSPTLIVKANKNSVQGIVPYARVGMHTGLASVKSTTTVARMPGKRVDAYSGNWSIGLLSAIGFTKPINKKVDLLIELTIKTISSRPKELRNLQNFEGQDSGMVTRFVKELNPNGPTNNELTFKIPFNSIGIGFGFQYKMGK